MKLLIVAVFVLISTVLSAPQGVEFLNLDDQGDFNNFNNQFSSQNLISILRYVFDQSEDGYNFTYELSDGQIRSEAGAYKDGQDEEGNPTKILVVQGAYSHVAPDGETYWTNYQADENGYRPKHGKGVGGIKPGEDAGIDPNLLKSLVG